MRNVISFVQLEEAWVDEFPKDQYEFQDKGRKTRKALQFLKGRGALTQVKIRTKEVKAHVADMNNLLSVVDQQIKHIRRYENRNPTRLLIGSDDWEKLMKDHVLVKHYMSFGLDYRASVREQGENKTLFMGLRVEIVPWMQGLVVLP